MIIVELSNTSILSHLQGIIKANFGDHDFLDWPETNYFTLVSNVQKIINQFDIVRELARDVRPTLEEKLKDRDILTQSGVYLRATRPTKSADAVGWHRESFYGCSPLAYNVWMPIKNVTLRNSIRYIPGSDVAEVKTTSAPDALITKGSDGNKIGLLYEPKTILAGVDFDTAQPVLAREGEVAIFPAELIHGAAQNQTDKIRFSIDCRVMAKKDLSTDHTKDGYFVPL